VQLAALAARRLAAAGVPEDTMWIVDLRGAAWVAFGARFSNDADLTPQPQPFQGNFVARPT
jgi:hypothetical protein